MTFDFTTTNRRVSILQVTADWTIQFVPSERTAQKFENRMTEDYLKRVEADERRKGSNEGILMTVQRRIREDDQGVPARCSESKSGLQTERDV